jgi:hypothetical protein
MSSFFFITQIASPEDSQVGYNSGTGCCDITQNIGVDDARQKAVKEN